MDYTEPRKGWKRPGDPAVGETAVTQLARELSSRAGGSLSL